MNNIYQIWKPNGAFYQIGSDNTFQNDLTNAASSPEVGGIVGLPKYASGSGWQSESGGMYQLAAGSPGFDQAIRINNFNDHFNGAAPDVGAAEARAMERDEVRRRGGERFDQRRRHGHVFAHADADSHADTGAGHRRHHDRQQSRRPQRRSQDARTRRRLEHARAGRNGRHHRLGRRLDHNGLVEHYTIAAGASVTFTARLAGNAGVPGGSMSFRASGSTIAGCGAVVVANGQATCTTSSLAAGTWSITGIYSGDATYGSGQAGPITQTVTGGGSASTQSGLTIDSSSYTSSVRPRR